MNTSSADIRSSLPTNLTLMDIDRFVKEHALQPVSSLLVMEPGESRFNDNGLYSERIFGSVASERRLTQPAYIDLHTGVLQPLVFANLVKLNRGFRNIMDGTSYAVFDADSGSFVPSTRDDPAADTGMGFFMKHVKDLRFTESSSHPRQNRVAELEKYRDILVIDKVYVLPAGLRDYQIGADGRPSVDEINTIYTSLMSYAMAIPPSQRDNPDYDPVRYAIQRKLAELYEHLTVLVAGPSGGKRGFLQSKWGSRALALSSRDVISAADMSATSVHDLRYQQLYETKVPLFLTAKGLEPVVEFFLSRIFFDHILANENDQVAMIDQKTFNLTYREIRPAEKDMYITTDGLVSFINGFRDKEVRDDPVVIHDVDGEEYWMYMVLDTGDSIYLFRNFDTFASEYEATNPGKKISKKDVRPLTRVELLTIATWAAVQNRYATVTRYPVTGMKSTHISKPHLVTTDPGRTVQFKSEFSPQALTIGEYPILSGAYVDSVTPHPSRLAGMGGDHDGDQVVVNFLIGTTACEECANFLASPAAVLDSNQKLLVGFNTDTLKLVLFALFQPVPQE